MFPIFAVGTAKHNAALCAALEQHGGVLFLGADSVCSHALGKPAYLLHECGAGLTLAVRNAIVLLGGAKELPLFAPQSNLTALLDENAAQPSPAEQPFAQILRCGMRKQDDISLASVGETQSLLSLGKKLKMLTGQELLPGDFLVNHSESIPRPALPLICACLLLTQPFADGVIGLG